MISKKYKCLKKPFNIADREIKIYFLKYLTEKLKDKALHLLYLKYKDLIQIIIP